MSTEKTVEQLATPITTELGLELVDVEFVKEGSDWFLRVYVDTPTHDIDIDQCAVVSERLSEELDRVDPISQNYFLEVSSPGAERPLKKSEDFIEAINEYVFIKTYVPFEGLKEFEGFLRSYNEEELTIEVRIKTRTITATIAVDKIALARLAINFSA